LFILGNVRPNGQVALKHWQRKKNDSGHGNKSRLRQLCILGNVRPNGQVALKHWQRKKKKSGHCNKSRLRQLCILGNVIRMDRWRCSTGSVKRRSLVTATKVG